MSNNRTEEGNGGGLFVANGKYQLNDVIIKNNYAFRYGGGAFISDKAEVNFQNGSITENLAQTEAGGGFAVTSSAVFNVEDSEISNNKVFNIGGRGGGGAFYQKGSGDIIGTEITNNIGDNGAGIAVFANDNIGQVNISESNLRNNNGLTGSAVFVLDASKVVIERTSAIDNFAQEGIITAGANTELEMDNSTVRPSPKFPL